MAVNAAKAYVVPAGAGLVSGIFGPGYGQDKWPQAAQGMFGPDPFASPAAAWNWQKNGLGVLDAPDALTAGMQEAQQRYLGDPNNGGAGGWNARWNQWNNTDVVGP